jgi:ribosomal protein S18
MADNKKNNRRNNNNDNDDYNPKYRKPRKKVCAFCADKNIVIEYKNVEQLKRYTSDKGKILPRRVSGCCAKHQREVTLAIKRARHIALLPYTLD